MWHGARGFSGKTHNLAALAVAEAVCLGADVAILGGSFQQSQFVRRYITEFFRRRELAPWVSLQLMDRFELKNGAVITALSASQTAVRGPHPQRLLLDEVDEMDQGILEAALGQPMEKNGIPAGVVASSTWQYPNGTFAFMLKQASDRAWPVYSWCYKETMKPRGWLSAADVERKRQTVSSGMWAVEYDLQQPSAENRAILPEAVEKLFDRDLGVFDGSHGEIIEIEPPQPGALYVHGADLARKQHDSVLITLRTDCRPVKLVAFWRQQRLPWSVMMGTINKQVVRYPGELTFDATGVGDAAAEFLVSNADGFMMVGRERNEMLNAFITAAEKGELRAPFIRSLYGELLFCSVDDAFGSGHLPDGFSAAALAWRAYTKQNVISWIPDPYIYWPAPNPEFEAFIRRDRPLVTMEPAVSESAQQLSRAFHAAQQAEQNEKDNQITRRFWRAVDGKGDL